MCQSSRAQYKREATTALENKEFVNSQVLVLWELASLLKALLQLAKLSQPKEVAEDYAKKLTEAGAEAEIK